MQKPGNVHWNQIVNPNETVTLEFGSESNLFITNICLVDIPETAEEKPNRLLANIITIDPYANEENVNASELPRTHLLMASLIPNQCEHVVTNICFSPLNIIKVQNQGDYPIHMAGYENSIIDDDDENEEEEMIDDDDSPVNDDSPDENAEDEDEELDQIDIQQKLLRLSKQAPKSSPQPKPKQIQPKQQTNNKQKQMNTSQKTKHHVRFGKLPNSNKKKY